jgi:hypothetical protein
MKNAKRWQMFLILSLYLAFIFVPAVAQNLFSIKENWNSGSSLQFENYTSFDSVGDAADYEETIDGEYYYYENTNSTNVNFNFTLTTRPLDFILAQGSSQLDPGFLIRVTYPLGLGDEIDFNFTNTGGSVEFFVFNQTQFDLWFVSEDYQPTEGIELIHTEIGASGTLTFNIEDIYYFVWFNDPSYNGNTSINLNFQLDARITEKLESGIIEIDPTTLEASTGEILDDFGMDTSDWELEKEVPLEISDRDIYFTIVREEELTISHNDKTTKIACWVLEKLNYERNFVGDETYKVKGDLMVWKSKIGGVTLKSTADLEYYDDQDTLFALIFQKYTVKATTKVSITKSASLIMFPILLGLLVIPLIRKRKKN